VTTEFDHCCPSIGEHAASIRVPIEYNSKFREYYVPLRDYDEEAETWYLSNEPVVIQCFAFCPWCGAKLPDSLRDQWFDELRSRGIEYALGGDSTVDVPLEFRSDQWWRSPSNE
jgi:hypothetical protein